MIICISSWEKYNPRPRKDVKSSSWFRCQNTFVTDPDFFDYSNDQKMIWICLCSEASARMSAEIKINPGLIASILRVSPHVVLATLEDFERSKFLSIIDATPITRSELAADPPRTRCESAEVSLVDGGATNGTNGTNKKRAKALSPRNSKTSPPKWAPDDLELAARWAEHARSLTPHIKIVPEKWADSIRLIREQDGLTLQEIVELFEWVKADEFWRMNAISPQAIRGRSKNGLKKIENIRLRMKEAGPGGGLRDELAWDKWIAEKEAEAKR